MAIIFKDTVYTEEKVGQNGEVTRKRSRPSRPVKKKQVKKAKPVAKSAEKPKAEAKPKAAPKPKAAKKN